MLVKVGKYIGILIPYVLFTMVPRNIIHASAEERIAPSIVGNSVVLVLPQEKIND